MDTEYDSSSEDGEYLWTAASRLLVPPCGKPSRTCKDSVKRSHNPSFRSRSAPPSSTPSLSRHPDHTRTLPPLQGIMLAAPTIDLNFDNDVDDDWMPPPSSSPRLYRAASVGNSWGVTSIGRGCVWNNHNRGDESESEPEKAVEVASDTTVTASKDCSGLLCPAVPLWLSNSAVPRSAAASSVSVMSTSVSPAPLSPLSSPRSSSYVSGPLTRSPVQSRSSSPRPFSSRPPSPRPTSPVIIARTPISSTPSSPRSTQFPRMRRRSSQQRVSLLAGRVSITPVEPPSPLPAGPQKLVRTSSAASFLSVASSVGPPTPNEQLRSVGDRSISEFVIEREIGRGAYGLVKRAREMMDDGTLGVRFRAYCLFPSCH